MKTFLICALIIVIPAAVMFLIAGLMRAHAEKMRKHAEELRSVFSKARHFQAKIANTEILMGWTVLTLVPTDGKTGFYLKTTRRDAKEGEIIRCAEIPEHPERAVLLKSAQIKPDESGLMIFENDYERLMQKIQQEASEGGTFMMFRQHVLQIWLLKVLPICIVLCIIVILNRK